MTAAVLQSSGSVPKVGVFYLDNPGAAGPIVVGWTGATGTGCVASLLSLSGTLAGYKESSVSALAAASNTGTASTSLTTTVPGSLVVSHHYLPSVTTLPTANSPLTQTCSIASAFYSGAAGYEFVASPATVTPTFTTTSGVAVVTVAASFAPAVVPQPYLVWSAGPFPSGKTLTDTDPTHDPDGGGLANAIEWVTGGDPTNSADDSTTAPTIDNTSDPDYFIFTYRRTSAANADSHTAIEVEYGSDFSGWTTAVHDGSNIIITPTVNGGGTGIDLVQVKIKRTLAAYNRIFARLNVTVTSS